MACEGNTELRERVESLLTAHNGEPDLIDELVAARMPELATLSNYPDRADPPAEKPPDSNDLAFLCLRDAPGCLGTLGSYEILEIIGRGGAGIVLKARDTKLQRIVAIKVLSQEIAANKMAKNRFTREARAAAAVSHDHIITVHAVEEFNGIPFIVMECVIGRSLQQKIEETGALELKEVLRIGIQVARGLAARAQAGNSSQGHQAWKHPASKWHRARQDH